MSISNNMHNPNSINQIVDQKQDTKLDSKLEQKNHNLGSTNTSSNNKNNSNKNFKNKANTKKQTENLNISNKAVSANKISNLKNFETLKKVIEIIKFAGIAKIDEIKLKTKDLTLVLKKNLNNKTAQIDINQNLVADSLLTFVNKNLSQKISNQNSVEITSKPNSECYQAKQMQNIANTVSLENIKQENNKTKKEYYKIISPMVGTFYRAPSPNSPPYVKEGDYIEAGTTVCIIEAMKLMNEIKSEKSGKVVRILVENAQAVEKGTVLFELDTEANK